MAVKFDELKQILEQHVKDNVSVEMIEALQKANTLPEDVNPTFNQEEFKKAVLEENDKLWGEKFEAEVEKKATEKARAIFFGKEEMAASIQPQVVGIVPVEETVEEEINLEELLYGKGDQ